MAPRRCKRCGDGLGVERGDQYGAYLVCMSCGDTTYPGLGAPRGPGEKPERNGLSDTARQVKTWRGTLYDRARKFPAPARCVWPDCHYCAEGGGMLREAVGRARLLPAPCLGLQNGMGRGSSYLGGDAPADALRRRRGQLLRGAARRRPAQGEGMGPGDPLSRNQPAAARYAKAGQGAILRRNRTVHRVAA